MKGLSQIIFFTGASAAVLLFAASLFKGDVPIDVAAFFNSLMIMGIGINILYSKKKNL